MEATRWSRYRSQGARRRRRGAGGSGSPGGSGGAGRAARSTGARPPADSCPTDTTHVMDQPDTPRQPRHVGQRTPARKGPAGRRPAGPPSQQPTTTNTPQTLHPVHLPGGAVSGLPPGPPHPPRRRGLAAVPSVPAVVEVFTQVPTPDPTSCNGRPSSAPARSEPTAERVTRRAVTSRAWTRPPSNRSVVPARFSYRHDKNQGPKRPAMAGHQPQPHLPPEVDAADATNTSSTPMQGPDAACGPRPSWTRTRATSPLPPTAAKTVYLTGLHIWNRNNSHDAMGSGAVTFDRSTVASFRAPAEPSGPTVLYLRRVG
jgi:hypothetical protein